MVAGGALETIADPLARLVAAGAQFKASRITPAGIALAVDTASNQGWRRPLLAWLGVQAQRAEAEDDTAAQAAIERRRKLAGGQ